MKLEITLQESNSRGQLLLRHFFGFFYILIPHGICLFFLAIGNLFVSMLAWWAILLTGKFPRSFFNYKLNMLRWGLRLNARLLDLVDGYPAFGLNAVDPLVTLEVPYQEEYSRGRLLLITFFGIFMQIPHIFCILFIAIGAAFVSFIAFWAILFTGKYPEGLHNFMVSYLRWTTRFSLYFSYMTPTYPPFNGKPDPAEQIASNFGS